LAIVANGKLEVLRGGEGENAWGLIREGIAKKQIKKNRGGMGEILPRRKKKEGLRYPAREPKVRELRSVRNEARIRGNLW